jgi:hypothetical protein
MNDKPRPTIDRASLLASILILETPSAMTLSLGLAILWQATIYWVKTPGITYGAPAAETASLWFGHDGTNLIFVFMLQVSERSSIKAPKSLNSRERASTLNI